MKKINWIMENNFEVIKDTGRYAYGIFLFEGITSPDEIIMEYEEKKSWKELYEEEK